MNFNISKERMLEGMHTMNSFGTRLTGSKGHNDFIRWLKEEITKMDIPVFFLIPSISKVGKKKSHQ